MIKQDAKGDFWIGTNDKGLNHWNRQNNTIDYYNASETSGNGLSANNIKSIIFDNQGKVLIGTHNGGLNILDPVSKRIKFCAIMKKILKACLAIWYMRF